MMRKLFGTDGIRGVAGQFPLDRKTVYAIGLAVAHSLRKQHPNPRVLVGIDTRESSTEIAAVLTLGLRQGGAEATSAGDSHAGAWRHLARLRGFAAWALWISSFSRESVAGCNGIKIFGGDGWRRWQMRLSLPSKMKSLPGFCSRITSPDASETVAPEVDPSLPAAYNRIPAQSGSRSAAEWENSCGRLRQRAQPQRDRASSAGAFWRQHSTDPYFS